jgi:hypothetical protein
MDNVFAQVDAWLIAAAFAVGMLACWVGGWRWGRKAPPESGEDPGAKFTDASMALLGLLLAFTFSMALGRHDERRLAVVAESNAIGDFYTCASLLKEPHRTNLQKVLEDYARDLLHLPGVDETTEKRRSQKQIADMTDIVGKVLGEGTPVAVSLTNTLNQVTSSNASRLAAFHARLPWSIVLLLFFGSVVPAFLIGEKQGAANTVHLSGSTCFIVLVTLVVYVILDLNQPRQGLITVSHESLERVIESMAR